MRARHLLFHLNCFKCFACERLLSTGDEFGIGKEGSVLCRVHYFCNLQQQPSSEAKCEDSFTAQGDPTVLDNSYFYNMCNLPPTPGISPPNNSSNTNNLVVCAPPFYGPASSSPSALVSPRVQGVNNKGRPKKRKMPDSGVSSKKANKATKGAAESKYLNTTKLSSSPQSAASSASSSSSQPPTSSNKQETTPTLDSPSDEFSKQFDSTLGKTHSQLKFNP